MAAYGNHYSRQVEQLQKVLSDKLQQLTVLEDEKQSLQVKEKALHAAIQSIEDLPIALTQQALAATSAQQHAGSTSHDSAGSQLAASMGQHRSSAQSLDAVTSSGAGKLASAEGLARTPAAALGCSGAQGFLSQGTGRFAVVDGVAGSTAAAANSGDAGPFLNSSADGFASASAGNNSSYGLGDVLASSSAGALASTALSDRPDMLRLLEQREAEIQAALQQLGGCADISWQDLYSSQLLQRVMADPERITASAQASVAERFNYWAQLQSQLALLLVKYDSGVNLSSCNIKETLDGLIDKTFEKIVIGGLWGDPSRHMKCFMHNVNTHQFEAYPPNWWEQVAKAIEPTPAQKASIQAVWASVGASTQKLLQEMQQLEQQLQQARHKQLQANRSFHQSLLQHSARSPANTDAQHIRSQQELLQQRRAVSAAHAQQGPHVHTMQRQGILAQQAQWNAGVGVSQQAQLASNSAPVNVQQGWTAQWSTPGQDATFAQQIAADIAAEQFLQQLLDEHQALQQATQFVPLLPLPPQLQHSMQQQPQAQVQAQAQPWDASAGAFSSGTCAVGVDCLSGMGPPATTAPGMPQFGAFGSSSAGGLSGSGLAVGAVPGVQHFGNVGGISTGGFSGGGLAACAAPLMQQYAPLGYNAYNAAAAGVSGGITGAGAANPTALSAHLFGPVGSGAAVGGADGLSGTGSTALAPSAQQSNELPPLRTCSGSMQLPVPLEDCHMVPLLPAGPRRQPQPSLQQQSAHGQQQQAGGLQQNSGQQGHISQSGAGLSAGLSDGAVKAVLFAPGDHISESEEVMLQAGPDEVQLEARILACARKMMMLQFCLMLQLANILTKKQLAAMCVHSHPYVFDACSICEAMESMGWDF